MGKKNSPGKQIVTTMDKQGSQDSHCLAHAQYLKSIQTE